MLNQERRVEKKIWRQIGTNTRFEEPFEAKDLVIDREDLPYVDGALDNLVARYKLKHFLGGFRYAVISREEKENGPSGDLPGPS